MANMVIFPTGLTYSRNTKAPFETNRVFTSLAAMYAYLDNGDQTGYKGMTIVVIGDTTASNDGVYVVTKEGGYTMTGSSMPSHDKIPAAQQSSVYKLATGGNTESLRTDLLEEIAKKADKSIKINGKGLDANITLTGNDINNGVTVAGTYIGSGENINSSLSKLDTAIKNVAGSHTTIAGVGGSIVFEGASTVSNGGVLFEMDEANKEISATVKGLGSAAYAATDDFDAAGSAEFVSTTLLGKSDDKSDAQTIFGAKAYADEKIAAAISSAINIKGTIGTGGTVTALPTKDVKCGDAYVVKTDGTYAGQTCEAGDIIIATATTTATVTDPKWTILQNNLTPATADTLGTVKLGVASVDTDTAVYKTYAIGNNASGKLAVSIPLADLQLATQDGHYTPSTGTAVAASGTVANNGVVITGISKDDKGHITAVTAANLNVGVTGVNIADSSDAALRQSSVTVNSGVASIVLKGKVFDGAKAAGETDEDNPGQYEGFVPIPTKRNSILFGDGTWHDADYVAPSNSDWGHAGLVPICDEAHGGPSDPVEDPSDLESLFLNGAGKWAVVAQKDTTYTFTSGTNGSFTVQALGGSKQTISIGKPATAGTADKVAYDLTIKKDSTTSVVFNGSAAQSIDLSIYALATDLQWHIYE